MAGEEIQHSQEHQRIYTSFSRRNSNSFRNNWRNDNLQPTNTTVLPVPVSVCENPVLENTARSLEENGGLGPEEIFVQTQRLAA